MVKLKYSRYNSIIKFEWVTTVPKVVICFLILMDLTKIFVEFCVIEVFKFWVRSRWMKE